MKKVKLFCDGSCNPQKKIGYGAYLLIEKEKYQLEKLKDEVVLKKFENTSSTKLELQTFIWALKSINITKKNIIIYTDCQNIISLPSRKEKIQKLNYHSSSGKLLNNSELYKEFFELLDKYNCSFIKVKGHKKSSLKDEVDLIFNIVDRISRKVLRES